MSRAAAAAVAAAVCIRLHTRRVRERTRMQVRLVHLRDWPTTNEQLSVRGSATITRAFYMFLPVLMRVNGSSSCGGSCEAPRRVRRFVLA